MTRIKKDLPVDCRLDSWWWLLVKILKVWCWHDQCNQSYCRCNVILHFISGQWPWAFLDGHFYCNSMAAPKGLEFSSSTLRLGDDDVSSWVTEHWDNHGATLPQKTLSYAETPAFWSWFTQENRKETTFLCGFIISMIYILLHCLQTDM